MQRHYCLITSLIDPSWGLGRIDFHAQETIPGHDAGGGIAERTMFVWFILKHRKKCKRLPPVGEKAATHFDKRLQSLVSDCPSQPASRPLIRRMLPLACDFFCSLFSAFSHYFVLLMWLFFCCSGCWLLPLLLCWSFISNKG